jgi:rhamnose utilization protein RhaD (predicted bifunctional aldolase and dehydrogenase)
MIVPEEQQAPETPVETGAPQPVAESLDLAAQLEALRAKNQELIAERRKDRENRETLQKQLEDIRAAQEQAKTAKLAESGEYKTLWEEAQNTVAELKQQLAAKEAEVDQIRQGFTQEQVKSAAIAQLSQAGALAPDQLYRLLQENLRAKEGQPVAVVGGVEVPVGEYIANLKNPGSGYEHHFAATNRAGMGVTGSARATALPGQTNPWLKDSWNVTQQMILLSKDPDKARLLKAEAGQ